MNMDSEDLGKSVTLMDSKSKPIKAQYRLSTEDGNVGVKVANKSGETTEGDISFITSMKSRFTGKDLVYVVNNSEDVPKAQLLLKQALGDNWGLFADVYTPTEVQGGEYKYAIVDAAPNIAAKQEGEGATNISDFNIRRVHEFLNTMLSRGTEATLFLNDGKVDEYVTFDSSEKDKVIRQTKLTPDVIKDIKTKKQELLQKILQDYVAPVALEGDKPSIEVVDSKAMPIAPYQNLASLFAPDITEPKVFKDNLTTMVAYNSFSTAKDFDSFFKLAFPNKLAQELQTPDIQNRVSTIINSYKYYLLHKNQGGLGDRQIRLRSNFEQLFGNANLDWQRPQYYMEIGERGTDGITQGRTKVNSTVREKPDDLLIHLKVKIPNKYPGQADLDFTMGFLNDIEKLIAVKQPQAEEAGLPTMKQFFGEIKQYIKGKTGKAPEFGIVDESDGKRWRSEPMDEETFNKIANIYNSTLNFDNAKRVNLKDFRSDYFDFAMSEPQVVVANLIGDNNKSILDYDDNLANKGDQTYKNIWDRLKGKAVMFVSDVYELNQLAPNEWLNHYIKQLSEFGTQEFADMNNEQRAAHIASVKDKITVGNVTIDYKPGLIKMIKVDNPKSDFMNFRERFLEIVGRKTVGAKMTPDLLEQFNTSIYVKDRLAKSLLTLQAMLHDTDRKSWIEAKIIDPAKKEGDAWIDQLYNQLEQDLSMNGEKLDRQAFVLSPLALEKHSPLNFEQFRSMLDDLLDPTAENSIFRGKYSTKTDENGEPTNRKKKSDLDTNLTKTDLSIKLSTNKLKDFSGSLIDLKLFNLFNRTKNGNFARLIDLSLKQLGSLETNGTLRKYDLSKVFKGGMIESVLIAKEDRTKDYTTNVLADAISFAGSDFTFDLGKLTHPYYSIDFDDLVGIVKGTPVERTKSEEVKPPITTEQPVESTSVVADAKGEPDSPFVEPETPTEKASAPKRAGNVSLDMKVEVPGQDPWVEQTLADALKAEAAKVHGSPAAEVDPIITTSQGGEFDVTMQDGSTYQMIYDMNENTIRTIPLEPAPEADVKSIVKAIEEKEMKQYDEVVTKMFGDSPNEVLTPVLDYFKLDFQHTMLSAALLNLPAERSVSLKEYNPDLAKYRSKDAFADYLEYFNQNSRALREYSPQIKNMFDYITDYNPEIC
jgi:hypothetical protein